MTQFKQKGALALDQLIALTFLSFTAIFITILSSYLLNYQRSLTVKNNIFQIAEEVRAYHASEIIKTRCFNVSDISIDDLSIPKTGTYGEYEVSYKLSATPYIHPVGFIITVNFLRQEDRLSMGRYLQFNDLHKIDKPLGLSFYSSLDFKLPDAQQISTGCFK